MDDGNHSIKKNILMMETSHTLNGDAEEPLFDQRFEFRDFAYDARSKFVIYVSLTLKNWYIVIILFYFLIKFIIGKATAFFKKY